MQWGFALKGVQKNGTDGTLGTVGRTARASWHGGYGRGITSVGGHGLVRRPTELGGLAVGADGGVGGAVRLSAARRRSGQRRRGSSGWTEAAGRSGRTAVGCSEQGQRHGSWSAANGGFGTRNGRMGRLDGGWGGEELAGNDGGDLLGWRMQGGRGRRRRDLAGGFGAPTWIGAAGGGDGTVIFTSSDGREVAGVGEGGGAASSRVVGFSPGLREMKEGSFRMGCGGLGKKMEVNGEWVWVWWLRGWDRQIRELSGGLR